MLVGYARVSTADQDLSLQTLALEKAGCRVGRNPSEIGELMAEVLKSI